MYLIFVVLDKKSVFRVVKVILRCSTVERWIFINLGFKSFELQRSLAKKSNERLHLLLLITVSWVESLEEES